MTLWERDWENRALGREEGIKEGSISTLNIIKLYNKGTDRQQIADELHIDMAMVDSVINNYEEM